MVKRRKISSVKDAVSILMICLLAVASFVFIVHNLSEGLNIRTDIISSLFAIIISAGVLR